MNYSKILSEINNLSTAELSQLNQDLIDIIKLRRRQDARMVKRSLEVGMTVKVNHPKAAGKTFEVVKINRTKVHLREAGKISLISAPLSLTEAI
jgi:hypothetical protein